MHLPQRIIRQSTSIKNAVFRLIDAASIIAGLIFAVRTQPHSDSHATLVTCMAAIGIYSLTAEFTAMYRNWQAVSVRRELACSLVTWAITLALLSTLGQFSLYTSELSGQTLLIWFGLTPAVSIIGRMTMRRLRRWLIDREIYCRGCAIIGINELGIQLARSFDQRPDLGLRFRGFYDDRPDSRTVSIPDDLKQRLGDLNELMSDAQSGKVSKVFITLPMRAEDRIKQLLDRLGDTTASVYIVPDFFVFQLLHSRWSDVQGLPVVSIYENPFYGVDGILKRITDIVVATALLFALAIPLSVVGLMVKLSSPGPIFFRQKRYGLDGKEIKVWKFRTMKVMENGPSFTQAIKNDPRITRLGSMLRKTSIDELPQLFNVIQGNMSLVGPRPHATAQNEEYRQRINGYMLRHKVKPGITGMAQVHGFRGETETIDKMEGRIKFDHRYIREWSWWLDLQILFKTFFVVLKRENAY